MTKEVSADIAAGDRNRRGKTEKRIDSALSTAQ